MCFVLPKLFFAWPENRKPRITSFSCLPMSTGNEFFNIVEWLSFTRNCLSSLNSFSNLTKNLDPLKKRSGWKVDVVVTIENLSVLMVVRQDSGIFILPAIEFLKSVRQKLYSWSKTSGNLGHTNTASWNALPGLRYADYTRNGFSGKSIEITFQLLPKNNVVTHISAKRFSGVKNKPCSKLDLWTTVVEWMWPLDIISTDFDIPIDIWPHLAETISFLFHRICFFFFSVEFSLQIISLEEQHKIRKDQHWLR